MTTAIAEAKTVAAVDTWSVGSSIKAIQGKKMSEIVVNVQSTDPDAPSDVVGVFGSHKARVCGMFGGRMARIAGWHFYIEAPTEQVDEISRDIAERYGVAPQPISAVEDFPATSKWIANYEAEIRVHKDRVGVLSDVFEIFKEKGVNIVSVWAGTPPKVGRGGACEGHAIIKAYIEDPSVVPAVREALQRKVDWAIVEAWPKPVVAADNSTVGIRGEER